ncbi:MAG: histidine kinase dimerization/phospho-acceptor domain-containing protein [Candidatus Eisenbacteria bacterium]
MNHEGLREGLPPPPFERLRERLIDEARAREQAGEAPAAEALRAIVDEWWNEQDIWNARVRELLGVHHEINNALVGVRGNAQLMLMNSAGLAPGVRERLEVVLRESGRIQEATARLRDLKTVLGSPVPRPRAA